MIDESELNNYFRGFVVYNTKTKKEIINYNGAKYFTPASNTKLFTFYTAYRTFKDSVTGFEYEIINDSLIIKGTADPTLLYGFEENRSLEFLKNSGKMVYLIDESIEELAFGDGWSWGDYGYSYMPEKSIFPIYGNLIEISRSKDSLEVIPNFFKKNIKIDDQLSLRRDKDENNFYIKGSGEIKERRIPFKTSNQLSADLLSKEIGSKVTLIPNRDTYNFKEYKSVEYDSVYKKMLEDSDNFIAEQLMLQVGNKVDSAYNVKKAIAYSLENYLQNIPQKPRWVDGSGLSRYNLFTPESNVFLLKKMYEEIPGEKLLSYFAVGGETGTLKSFYKNEKPYIFAKSGTLSNNYNLSGYLITKKGTVLIFSYMNNHYKGSSIDRKNEMENFFLKLYELK
jgi:D-alanyl-D-alanine carboxypeptidase/D-alanyl-D-alanine-endopeptidase (penicillin-binding protein 4)